MAHSSGSNENNTTDEIKLFQTALWISPPEAAWRIFKFFLIDIYPNVLPLQVHLENMQNEVFRSHESLQDVVDDYGRQRTMLSVFFERNQTDGFARSLLYKDFPEHYVWESKKNANFWCPQKKQCAIARLVYASPTKDERYYLRLLLANVRGPLSFTDLKTAHNVIYTSFREAAFARGLLEADDSIEKCVQEATKIQMPSALRRLFVTLLVHCSDLSPKSLMEKYFQALSEDYRHIFPSQLRKVYKLIIKSISYLLETTGKRLETFGFDMSTIEDGEDEHRMKEIEEELHIPISPEEVNYVNLLNLDQKNAYDIIYDNVIHHKVAAYFVDGPGGTGNSFLYHALLANLRAKGIIALAIATSGIVASNIAGGRTANSHFKIPLDVEEHQSPNISKQSVLGQLIRASRLIIWDEASMAKRQTIELFERTLRDVCSSDQLFGGKIVVFGG